MNIEKKRPTLNLELDLDLREHRKETPTLNLELDLDLRAHRKETPNFKFRTRSRSRST